VSENIDLAKTFAQLGGTNMPGDGHSLLPLLRGEDPGDWRNAALVEHHGPDRQPIDPDFQLASGGNPSTYEAMRTHRFLYVEYDGGDTEFYDLRSDPFELHNLAPALTVGERALLHAELTAMENCHDGASCWAAMHVDADRPLLNPRRARQRLARARARAWRGHHRRARRAHRHTA
jgi:arylsulfatase A-like enzyme